MVGCTDGNSHTFFLVVLYTWLEHGWSMVVLGIVCIIIAAIGYVFPAISVSVICIADAAVKLICGVYLLFFSRPSKFTPSATK